MQQLQGYRNSQDTGINALREKIGQIEAELPQKCVDLILQRVEVQGASMVSIGDIRNLIAGILNEEGGLHQSIQTLTTQQSTLIARMDSSASSSLQPPASSPSNSVGGVNVAMVSGTFHVWPGDSRLHTVPHGFVFPSYSVSTMWNLWFFGNAADKICPYKSICRKWDLVPKLCKTNFDRCGAVMTKLVDIAVEGSKIANRNAVNPVNSSTIFEYAYPVLAAMLYNNTIPTRLADININTIANRLQKRNSSSADNAGVL
jgi:hypothetical protein